MKTFGRRCCCWRRPAQKSADGVAVTVWACSPPCRGKVCILQVRKGGGGGGRNGTFLAGRTGGCCEACRIASEGTAAGRRRGDCQEGRRSG
ncbi:hypothetical protein NDU88_002253 [Pleurodeles waltl]|uniref:Uncharacterized protein n=1 Tax=Pleurodeles waltl TaxID=8319 RepID=A0AAV7W1V7_PLEWA|nr:hypothetical protein NDU88_002253 [Pleurodeles waltl]